MEKTWLVISVYDDDGSVACESAMNFPGEGENVIAILGAAYYGVERAAKALLAAKGDEDKFDAFMDVVREYAHTSSVEDKRDPA